MCPFFAAACLAVAFLVSATVADEASPSSTAWDWHSAVPHSTIADDGNFTDAVRHGNNVVVAFFAPWCTHCDGVRQALAEATPRLRALGARVVIASMDTTQREASSAHVDAVPALRLFHFGRANHDVVRFPMRSATGIVDLVRGFASPGAARLSAATAEELQERIREEATAHPVVVGYYTDPTALGRVAELGRSFRSLVAFFTVADPRLHRAMNRTDALVVYRHRCPRMLDAQRRIAKGLKAKAARGKIDVTRPDAEPTPFSEAEMAVAEAELRAAEGFWAHEEVDLGAAIEEQRSSGAPPEMVHALDGTPTPLGPLRPLTATEGFQLYPVTRWLYRAALPPVGIMTAHNRNQYDARAPVRFLLFTKDVAIDAVAEAERIENAATDGNPGAGRFSDESMADDGVWNERNAALRASPAVRYAYVRLQRVSVGVPNATFLLCARDENEQIFQQFGLDRDQYHAGGDNLLAALAGHHKYVYPHARFDYAKVMAWAKAVATDRAVPFKHSLPAPPGQQPAPGSGSVAVAVYDTFDEMVVEPAGAHDVLSFFAGPDAISRDGLDAFRSLCEAERGNKQLHCVVFNALHNDPPEDPGYAFGELPTVFLSTAATRSAPAVYRGNLSLKSLAGFLKSRASRPPRNTLLQ